MKTWKYFACIVVAFGAYQAVMFRMYGVAVYVALWCLVMAVDSVGEEIIRAIRETAKRAEDAAYLRERETRR